MRLSRFPLATTKETPADAEIVSHQLMLRAGYIRKLGAGLYTWMPIGLRVLRKIENIVREEMNRAGALEVLMPTIQPAEFWRESGRWDVMGAEMLRLEDRHDNQFCYAPTAEEVITHHVRQDIRSYKQLPVNYYQIQTKFRDERRPRFGLMRGREFLMKDAYSFHMDKEDLAREYENMREAYVRIFTRVGADFRAVQADSGNIGGSASEEFHILAGAGEDLLAVSSEGSYAANVEAAVTLPSGLPAPAATQDMNKIATPDAKTCEEVSSLLGLPLKSVIKFLIFKDRRDEIVGVALRGDHMLNLIKLDKLLGENGPAVLASEQEIENVFGCKPGFLGPVVMSSRVRRIIADFAAAEVGDFVCGANQNDHHFRGVNWGRDCKYTETADLRMIVEGDPSPDGQGTIKLLRGIEGGHIFQLGQKYSKAMSLSVLNEAGEAVTPQMGCYGIGVSRMAAAVIEQSFDANGIIWPDAIAPFRVIVTPIGTDKSQAAKDAAEKLYQELIAAGVEAALDDRGLRPGPMFADADLIGIPHRIVIGDKGLANAQFEYKHRRADKAEMIPATCDAVLAKLS